MARRWARRVTASLRHGNAQWERSRRDWSEVFVAEYDGLPSDKDRLLLAVYTLHPTKGWRRHSRPDGRKSP